MVQPLENLRRYGARDYGSVWVNVFNDGDKVSGMVHAK
jgi:hypothetical protein